MLRTTYRSAAELVRLIRSKELSPREIMEETLGVVEALNPVINAFVSLRAEQAMDDAKLLTERIASGKNPGPLAGVPLAVKDLEDVKGMVTSFGSMPYKDNVASHDSIQVSRLKAAGAIIIGKTNTPEFGFTTFTKNRLFGTTRNPWQRDRTPGGSSGGSAAAVTAGMVPMATGSDAGGSIRIPASYCGCFGFKPSCGRIPLGPFPLLQMHSLWTYGPLTRTVRDAALYLDCVAGYHPADPQSFPPPEGSFVDCLDKSPAGLRIVYTPDLGFVEVKQEVTRAVEQALTCFEEMGHRVERWELKFPDVGQAWSTLMVMELYGQLHGDMERQPEKLGRGLVEFANQGKSFSMNDRIAAQKIRTAMNQRLWELFENVDLLITPATANEAYAAEGPPPQELNGRSVSLLNVAALTYPFNLSGHPAASVRAGFVENGLPINLQIVGPRYRDDLVLQVAYAYEQTRLKDAAWPSLR